jgi:hypothetical protein
MTKPSITFLKPQISNLLQTFGWGDAKKTFTMGDDGLAHINQLFKMIISSSLFLHRNQWVTINCQVIVDKTIFYSDDLHLTETQWEVKHQLWSNTSMELYLKYSVWVSCWSTIYSPSKFGWDSMGSETPTAIKNINGTLSRIFCMGVLLIHHIFPSLEWMWTTNPLGPYYYDISSSPRSIYSSSNGCILISPKFPAHGLHLLYWLKTYMCQCLPCTTHPPM